MTRDWHAERYAAAEGLAKTTRRAVQRLRAIVMFLPTSELGLLDELDEALAEYERTKDAP